MAGKVTDLAHRGCGPASRGKRPSIRLRVHPQRHDLEPAGLHQGVQHRRERRLRRHAALSSDGSTLAVGVSGESSAATGINGNQADDSRFGAGAVYLYR